MSDIRSIALSRGMVATVDEDMFEWLSGWRWYACCPGSRVFYACRNEGKGRVYMHRAITAKRGMGPGEVDHINHDGLDNRTANLRIVASSQNKQNTRLRADSTTGYKGVYYNKQRGSFQVYIRAEGRHKYIGAYANAESAAAAYDEAALRFYGEHAFTNRMVSK